MLSLVFMALIVWLIGMFWSIYHLYYFSYFLLFLFLFLKLYLFYLKRNIKIEHKILDNYIFLQESTQVKVTIINQGYIPIIWLRINELIPRQLGLDSTKKVLLSLRIKEKKIWQIKIKGKQRGLYQIGPLYWETGDIMGFKSISAKLAKTKPLIIYPQILPLETLGIPSHLPYGERKYLPPIYQDPNQTKGIRDYRPGDSIRQIYWKASAKTGKLQVRENESTVAIETVIALNLNQAEYGLKRLEERSELAICVTASIINYLYSIRQAFSLLTNAHDPLAEKEDFIFYPPGKGELHFQQVMALLARIEIGKKQSFLRTLQQNFSLSWGATIIIITIADTEELLTYIFSFLKRGYSVKILVLGEKVIHKQYLNLSFIAPLTIYQINREEDLYEL